MSSEPAIAAAKAAASETKDSGKASKSLEVVLEHGRSKHLGWAAFCLVAGVLLLWKFGSIGQGIGVVLLVVGAYQSAKAVQTFRHPPGTFKVNSDSIVVPTGLCRGNDLELSKGQLQHAFFLRRAVPWTQAGPLLIIESGGRSYSYPRDWFASSSDQERVQRALNQRLRS